MAAGVDEAEALGTAEVILVALATAAVVTVAEAMVTTNFFVR
jgi:hypothetical protein